MKCIDEYFARHQRKPLYENTVRFFVAIRNRSLHLFHLLSILFGVTVCLLVFLELFDNIVAPNPIALELAQPGLHCVMIDIEYRTNTTSKHQQQQTILAYSILIIFLHNFLFFSHHSSVHTVFAHMRTTYTLVAIVLQINY